MARKGWQNKMRVVKIDPVSRTVTEINLKKNPNNTLQELYEIIGCDLVELVQIDRDMVLICDEEGKCTKMSRGRSLSSDGGRSLPE
jgi:hypothetical protein